MKTFENIPTPQDLSNKIDILLETVQKKATSTFFGLIPLKGTSLKVDALILEILKLQSAILQFKGSLPQYQLLRNKLIEYERRAAFIKLQSHLMTNATLAYIIGVVLIYIVVKGDVSGFIVKTLGVDAPEKMISLGIAGAGLFVATDYLQRSDILNKGNTVSIFLIRLSLAIVVPIVIVVLFFDNKGNVRKISFTPEVLSFICGYSSKVVIGIFNKIVEKATKMIEAI